MMDNSLRRIGKAGYDGHHPGIGASAAAGFGAGASLPGSSTSGPSSVPAAPGVSLQSRVPPPTHVPPSLGSGGIRPVHASAPLAPVVRSSTSSAQTSTGDSARSTAAVQTARDRTVQQRALKNHNPAEGSKMTRLSYLEQMERDEREAESLVDGYLASKVTRDSMKEHTRAPEVKAPDSGRSHLSSNKSARESTKPATIAPSSTATSIHDADLVSAMAQRLADAERQLKKRDFMLSEVKSLNQKLRRQIVEMEEFLGDYGLKWVGKEAENDRGDGAKQRPDPAAPIVDQATGSAVGLNGTAPMSKLPSATQAAPTPVREKRKNATIETMKAEEVRLTTSAKETLPFNLDKVVESAKQLSWVAGEGVTAYASVGEGPHGMQRLSRPEPLPVTLYLDGIMVRKGPFRPYTDPQTILFMKDLEDGYFPYELKHAYPNGVPIEVTVKVTQAYATVAGPATNVFKGAGCRVGGTGSGVSRLLSEKSISKEAARDAYEANTSQAAVGRSTGAHAASGNDRNKYLSRLQGSVIRNGRIVPIREDIATLVETPLAREEQDAAREQLMSLHRRGSSSTAADVCTILVRSDDGTATFLVKLRPTDTIGTLREYINLERFGDGEYVLLAHPRKRLLNLTKTVAEMGLAPNAVVIMCPVKETIEEV